MSSYQNQDVENAYGSFERVPLISGAKASTSLKGFAAAAIGFGLVLCATLASAGSPGLAAASVAVQLSPEQLSSQSALMEQIDSLKTQLNGAESQLATLTGVSTTNAAAMPDATSVSDLTITQYDLIYNFCSFVTAAMGSATFFFFFQFAVIAKEFKNALLVSAMVTLIATYHYFRIFGSFTEAYFALDGVVYASGTPFNDAYRYVDWLLTVPLLLMELILVMQLSPDETAAQCTKLGSLAAIMVILGYPGEISESMSTRWLFWGLAMIPFLVIVYTLFFGLQHSVDKQPAQARDLVSASRWITVLSWCTYPVVFIFPMIGFTGASAQTAVQVGYSIADVIAKPVMGLVVWRIAVAKSSD